jgi:hypothetical protein
MHGCARLGYNGLEIAPFTLSDESMAADRPHCPFASRLTSEVPGEGALSFATILRALTEGNYGGMALRVRARRARVRCARDRLRAWVDGCGLKANYPTTALLDIRRQDPPAIVCLQDGARPVPGKAEAPAQEQRACDPHQKDTSLV